MSSLREQLAAAMTGDDSGQDTGAPAANDAAAAPVAETAAPADPGQAAAAPAEAAAEAPKPDTEAAAGAPVRDESGRFAPKTTDTEPAPAPDAEASTQEPIRVPASLPAALKAKFAELPPEWQEVYLARDEDVNKAKAQWDTKAAQFNRLEEVIGPRREQLTLAGITDADYLKTLFAADDWLKKDAPSAIAYLARSYGVDLRQFGGQAPGQHQQAQDPYAPQLSAALQPIMQQVQTLQQSFQQQTAQAEQAKQATVQAEIAAFAGDPAHLYFPDVKEHVAALLETGAAETLKDAYDMAVWASPTIRPLLLEAQSKAAAAASAKAEADAKAKADAAAQAKAAAAGKAAGSVTGAPGQAVAPPLGSQGSIRADLLAAMGTSAV